MSLRVLVTAPRLPKYQDLESRLKTQERYQLVPVDEVRNIGAQFKEDPVGIWLAYAPDRQKLVEILAVLRMLRQSVEDGDVKVIVTLHDRNPMVARKLIESGAHEVLVEPVQAKTIEAKLNRLSARLGLDPIGSAGSASESASPKKRQPAPDKKEVKPENVQREVDWVPAITGECECWVFARREVRRNLGTWTSLLVGPTPSEGNWSALKVDTRTGEGEWKWTFSKPDQKMCREKGDWIFHGRKPEFRGENWALMGASPQLFFQAEGLPNRYKLRTTAEHRFQAAENSAYAAFVLPVLQEAVEKTMRLREMEKRQVTREELAKRERETEIALTESIRNAPLSKQALIELEAILEQSVAPAKLDLVVDAPSRNSDAYSAELDRALGPLGDGPRLGLLGLAFFLSEISAVPKKTTEERVQIARRLFEAALGGKVEFLSDRMVITSSIPLPDGWAQALEELSFGLRLELKG